MTKRGNSAIELLKEILVALEREGFKFYEKPTDKESGFIAESEPNKSGHFIVLHAIHDHLFRTIAGNRCNGESMIDNAIRNIMTKKFNLSKIVVKDDTFSRVPEITKATVDAFVFYDKAWKRLLSERDLASFLNCTR